MLWVDKHRPTSLEKLSYHDALSTRLADIAEGGDMPHMLFYGPSGAGKKTRIMSFLRAIYGPGVEKLKLEHRSFKTPSKKTFDVTTVASNFHIELNPGDVGNADRYLVQEVIKEIAQYHPLDPGASKGFKVVLLTETDRLTKDAQAALRRTMEKYSSSCRLILYCESISKIIEPLRSRCLCMRVPAPTEAQICDVLQTICKRENLQLSQQFAAKVAKYSGRNLRRAILALEASKVQQYPFYDDQEVQLPDWERFTATIAQEILAEQSPQRLLDIRSKLYALLTNCIPASVIIKTLSSELMKKCDDELKHEVVKWAAHYEHRMQRGSKEIYHLEAFVAKFMSVYKRYILEMMG